MKLDICPTLLIKIAILLPCGIFIQSWLSFPNISFHTWYWWAKGKNSFHWLYRFLEPSIFSRSPQISHLKFQSCVFRCQATSLFFFFPTCSCPLASSSSLGFLSFLKSLPVSGKKFKLYRQFAKNLLVVQGPKSKNLNGIAFMYYTRITDLPPTCSLWLFAYLLIFCLFTIFLIFPSCP